MEKYCNMSLCENNCTLEQYEEETKKVTCECKIKLNDADIVKMYNDTNILYYNFTKKDLSTNIVTMKCVYVLFSKEGISTNIANYIFIFFIIFFIISGILFYKCGYPLLENFIKKLILLKQENNKENIQKTIEPKKNKVTKVRHKKFLKMKIKKNKSKLKITNNNIEKTNQKNFNSSSNNVLPKIDLIIYKYLKQQNKQNNEIINNKNEKIVLNDLSTLNDYELNSLLYIEALKYDRRTYNDYYISLIKAKHPVIFLFSEDYNSKIIKINLFLLSFCIHYFFNALFLNESLIHKIYEDEGFYNLSYLIQPILYSFIFSHILYNIIKYLFLSERNIINIKRENKIGKAFDIFDKEKKNISIKYFCFYLLSFIFLLLIWYYLSSFGAVYQNTQKYLIKNVLISFGFSLLFPFPINIIPGIFRIYSLKSHDRECIYKFSNIMNNI